MGTPARPEPPDAAIAVLESLKRLDESARLFRAGMDGAYRSVAVELRKLLIDRPRALLARAVHDPTLHPPRLSGDGRPPRTRGARAAAEHRMVFAFDFQGSLALPSEHVPAITIRFARDEPPLPVDEWLAEPILPDGTAVRTLILESARPRSAPSRAVPGRDDAAVLGESDPHGSHRERHQVLVALGDLVAERTLELLDPSAPG